MSHHSTPASVLLIYTGGTIGMIQNPETGALENFNFDQLLQHVPEIKQFNLDIFSYTFNPPIDSSDMNPTFWAELTGIIYSNYERYDGFVILHGTDTMAFTASALSFMLEGLMKPVILTGSQLPIGALRTDGKENLLTAIEIAAAKNPDGTPIVPEVCVFFHEKLMRGNRTTKRSSDQLLAFDSPNCPHLAEAGITIQYNRSVLLPAAEGAFTFHPFKEDVPVGVIKVFPGIQFEIFEHIMTDRLKGVVLETFGAGNIPSTGNYLLHIIEKAYKSGTIITVCSQCMQGTVTLGQYATSKALHDIGAVNGKDMTTEAALTKLYHLFSLDISKEEIKRRMSMSLRGELNE